MNDYILFGDVDSRNYNVWVFDLNTDGSPDLDQEEITVQGRHGTLLLPNGRLENVQHRYMGVIYEDAERNLINFRDAIMQYDGYQRLSDSIHIDEYYMARYTGGLDPKLARGRDMIKFAIEFDRMPQRFLLEGERAQTVLNGSTLLNPTFRKARPLIRVYGYGTLGVGSVTVTITQHSYTYIDIDCDMMDCYYGATNCNSLVTFSGNDFPVLPYGKTGITYSGNITRVDVTPRYWRV